MINCRRKAREAILQALFQCDVLRDWSESSLTLYFQQFQSTPLIPSASGNEHLDFYQRLLKGIISNLPEIDIIIANSSRHWSVARMSVIDRNIIRMHAYEICYVADIPPKVSINEAIEIAKRYSSDESPMFINGVLDNIASNFAREGLPVVKLKKVVNQ